LTDFHGGVGQKFFDFDDKSTMHTMDLTLSYSLSGGLPLSFELSSLVYGYDPKEVTTNANGEVVSWENKNYSTYFGVGYPVQVNETAVEFTVGAMLGESYWYGAEKAGITNVGLKASKQYKLSDSFSFTGFFQLVTNPLNEQALVVVGINL